MAAMGDRLHDATASPVWAIRVGGRGLVLQCWILGGGARMRKPDANRDHTSATPHHPLATRMRALAGLAGTQESDIWILHAGRRGKKRSVWDGRTLRQDCRRLPSLPQRGAAGSQDPFPAFLACPATISWMVEFTCESLQIAAEKSQSVGMLSENGSCDIE